MKGTKRNIRGRVELGDIIVGLNKDKITEYDDLYNSIEKYKIGDEVTIYYIRDGHKKNVKLKLSRLN